MSKEFVTPEEQFITAFANREQKSFPRPTESAVIIDFTSYKRKHELKQTGKNIILGGAIGGFILLLAEVASSVNNEPPLKYQSPLGNVPPIPTLQTPYGETQKFLQNISENNKVQSIP